MLIVYSWKGASFTTLKMPLWHEDYFELNAVKTQYTQENLLPLP